MNKKEKLINLFASSGFDLNDFQAEQFLKLTDFMLDYNEKVNLTAITDYDDVIMKHYLDSVLPMKYFEIPEKSTIIDIGTGAGFPAVPMLILRPDLKFTLVDSLNKRIVYLKQLLDLLSISGETVHSRTEDLAAKRRESYDFATARAVANLPVLCEYCLPYVKRGGHFLAMKGAEDETLQSTNAIKLLGGRLKFKREYCLPNGDSRNLIVIKKISQTSTKYPRNAGVIKKKPL